MPKITGAMVLLVSLPPYLAIFWRNIKDEDCLKQSFVSHVFRISELIIFIVNLNFKPAV